MLDLAEFVSLTQSTMLSLFLVECTYASIRVQCYEFFHMLRQ